MISRATKIKDEYIYSSEVEAEISVPSHPGRCGGLALFTVTRSRPLSCWVGVKKDVEIGSDYAALVGLELTEIDHLPLQSWD